MLTHEIRLGRFFPGQVGQPFALHLHCFQLEVKTRREGGQMVAIFEPLEAECPGVGENEEDAILDFIDGFTTIVDFHVERGTFERFVGRHFSRKTTRTVPLNLASEEREDQEIYSSVVQPWQIPHFRSSSAAAA